MSPSWMTFLQELDNAKIVLFGIFGAGLLSAAGYAIASVIRAVKGAPDDSEELRAEIASLESRVARLEATSQPIESHQYN